MPQNNLEAALLFLLVRSLAHTGSLTGEPVSKCPKLGASLLFPQVLSIWLDWQMHSTTQAAHTQDPSKADTTEQSTRLFFIVSPKLAMYLLSLKSQTNLSTSADGARSR